jgi:Protein of unknown function (DUF3047)
MEKAMVEKFFRWFAVGSVVLVAVVGLSAFQGRISPATLIVLDAGKAPVGKTPSSQIPPGWGLKVNAGVPDITFSDQGDESAFHFRSAKSSFGLERAVDIDPAQMPYLSWHWKVTQLPKGGDFRHGSTDDQAAQVLVAFDDRHIITYLWDSTAPQGTMESASSIPFVHIFAIVCRSGSADTNQWLQENHNVAADYQKAFGKPATHIKGLRIQINSQHTGSSAESYFGEVAFHSTQL